MGRASHVHAGDLLPGARPGGGGKKKPELKNVEPFKTVLSGDREAIAKLTMRDLEKILAATLTGMTVEEFNAEAKEWIETAKHPRWKRPYTELTYQPMQEVLRYLRANGYKTYIVTGGGQDFVRVYSEQVYGIPPEQVVGTAGGTKYGYDKNGKPFLTKEPKLLLNDNNAGKPEGIHLMIGRRPYAAFGNSTGDRQMLEYTEAGDGARLSMLVLHDDAKREYAYGPAQGLPDTKVGTFTQALYDEARRSGWTVMPERHRHLLRQCRRRHSRCGAWAACDAGSGRPLRRHLGLRHRRAAARTEELPEPRLEARANGRLPRHRLHAARGRGDRRPLGLDQGGQAQAPGRRAAGS